MGSATQKPGLNRQTLVAVGMQRRSRRGFLVALALHLAGSQLPAHHPCPVACAGAGVCKRRSGGFFPFSPLIAARSWLACAQAALCWSCTEPRGILAGWSFEELGNLHLLRPPWFLPRGLQPLQPTVPLCFVEVTRVRVGACFHCSRLHGSFSRMRRRGLSEPRAPQGVAMAKLSISIHCH